MSVDHRSKHAWTQRDWSPGAARSPEKGGNLHRDWADADHNGPPPWHPQHQYAGWIDPDLLNQQRRVMLEAIRREILDRIEKEKP